MHRMGRGGSKMREFEDFEASLKPLWPAVLRLQQATPENLSEAGWREMSEVFRGIVAWRRELPSSATRR